MSAAPGSAAPPPGFHVLRPRPRREWVLRGPPIVHRGTGGRAEVALTFDDGPSPWTAAIAAAFERYDCLATFFLRGAAVAERPEEVAALAAAGHELGNHLWSHPRVSRLDRARIVAEIERTAKAIESAGAPPPRLLRPPYFDAPWLAAEAAGGLSVHSIVMRSIGSSDWAAESAEQIVAPVLENIEAGDIVCLHDGVSPDEPGSAGRELTVAAVELLVPALLERNLRPVTVTRLLA